MAEDKTRIGSIIKGKRRARGHIMPANDAAVDDVRLLQEISQQVEQEKDAWSFDASRLDEPKACLNVEKDEVLPVKSKRPAPKHNKALKEAERVALQKPVSPNRYRQIMKEHLELLPFMFKIMD